MQWGLIGSGCVWWNGNEGEMKWIEKEQRKWNYFINTREGMLEMNGINCMERNNEKEDDWEGVCEWDKEMIEDDEIVMED